MSNQRRNDGINAFCLHSNMAGRDDCILHFAELNATSDNFQLAFTLAINTINTHRGCIGSGGLTLTKNMI